MVHWADTRLCSNSQQHSLLSEDLLDVAEIGPGGSLGYNKPQVRRARGMGHWTCSSIAITVFSVGQNWRSKIMGEFMTQCW
jgi:hypothetical protein